MNDKDQAKKKSNEGAVLATDVAIEAADVGLSVIASLPHDAAAGELLPAIAEAASGALEVAGEGLGALVEGAGDVLGAIAEAIGS